MIVRVSPRLRFNTGTVVVESGGESVTDVVEAVAEAVTEAVEATAEAVAEAVEDASSGEHSEDLAMTVGKLVVLVEAMGIKIAELEGAIQSASATAQVALSEAEAAATPGEVEEIVDDALTAPVVESEVSDTVDEPPAGVGKSLVFEDWSGLKKRFAKKVSD